MDTESEDVLLIRAAAAYKGVVADPATHGPLAIELVAEARQAGHPEALVVALRAAAWAERALFANERARSLLDEGARLAGRHDLDGRLAEVLVSRAAVNLELGRVVAAQRDLDRAGQLIGGASSPELDLQMAVLDQNLGRLGEAAAVYRRSLENRDTPSDVRAKMANNLAIIEIQLGEHDGAQRWLAEAADAATLAGPALVAIVAQTTAWANVQAGRLTEGLTRFEEAARLYEAAGLSLGEHFVEHADALADLRLLPEAHEMVARALAYFAERRVGLMEAEARVRSARLLLLSGEPGPAATEAALAADQLRAQRRRSWAAQATVIEADARALSGDASLRHLQAARRGAELLERRRLGLEAIEAHLASGRLALALGRSAAACASFDRADALAAGAPVLTRLKGHVAGALAARIRGDDAAVIRRSRAGLDELASYRAALGSLELRARASSHGAELGRLGLGAALGSGSASRVFAWLERTRAAALVVVERPPIEGVEEDLAELRAVTDALIQLRDDGAGQPSELVAHQRSIETRIRRAAWARVPPEDRPATADTLATVRAALTDQVVVTYGTHGGASFAVVVHAGGARLVELPARDPDVAAETAALLFALRRMARPRPAPGPIRDAAEVAIARLHAVLVAPLRLERSAELIVVPVPQWHRIPWAALHEGPVTVVPSASVWNRTRQRPAPTDGPVVLVAGPGLPGAVAEVDAIRSLYRSPTTLRPPASTAADVAAALDGAALAHLACHGLLRADNPLFSSLVLSDGLLSVHELDARGIAPHRMILAACDVAADRAYEGDEMLGFVSALFARGTAALLASVVTLPDEESAALMCEVHAALVAGASMSRALHTARQRVERSSPQEMVTHTAFNAFGAS